MTAKSPLQIINPAGKHLWVWVLGFFGVVLIGLVVAYLLKKAKGQSPQPSNGQNQPQGTDPVPPVVTPPPTSTPPYIPTDNPATPVDVYNVNWAYVQDLSWKMYETYFGRNSYACELSNGVIEMGDNDLRAFVQTYKQWYNRNLKDDYCNKVKSSDCWTSWWDDKPATACNRLKNLI